SVRQYRSRARGAADALHGFQSAAGGAGQNPNRRTRRSLVRGARPGPGARAVQAGLNAAEERGDVAWQGQDGDRWDRILGAGAPVQAAARAARARPPPRFLCAGTRDGVDIVSVACIINHLALAPDVRWYAQIETGMIAAPVIEGAHALMAGACDYV